MRKERVSRVSPTRRRHDRALSSGYEEGQGFMSSTAAAHEGHDEYPSFWRRWFLSTNHKDIGTLYLILAICGGVIGGFLSAMMRLELQTRA
jgi:hypothetical protein